MVPDAALWFRPLVTEEPRPDIASPVTALLEDRAGRLWIGKDAGDLYAVDASTGARLAVPSHVLDGTVSGLYEDRSGVIWAGARRTGGGLYSPGGLYRLDPQTGKSKHYRAVPNAPDSLSQGSVNTIYEDAAGALWVGTWWGLNRLDRATDTFTWYLHDENDPGSLGGNVPYPIYEDRQGTLWVGTTRLGSLNRYDREKDRFTSFLPGLRINALLEDTLGRFWVGTYGRGMFRVDRTTGTASPFTTADGLAHNIVGGIIEDDQGYLWMATAAGPSRFDPESESIVNFTEADGFPNTITDPEPDEFLKSRNGTLIIGGEKGVTIISPDRVVSNPHPPEVVVIGLQVFDEPFQEAGLLPSSFRLAHDQNDLTFEYVGLHFARPEKNRYAYQLEGYDADRREVGAERTARYTSLDPGTYTFRVKASNGDGVWNQEGASVRVTILPPWWRTMWAYLLYGLLFLGGVFAADRIQRRRLIAREQEKARARELEQAREIEKAHQELQQSHAHVKATQAQLVQSEKMASLGALTAGIAHEIKNPLNFVNNFSEIVVELSDELQDLLGPHLAASLQGEADDFRMILGDLKQNAGVIAEHGKRADGIVQSMMQHASGGSGEREPTDVNALVEEYFNLAYHGMRAQTMDFNVTMGQDYDDDAGTVEMVPQDIGRVLINLFNNAFYAVHEKADAGRVKDAGMGGRGDAETGYEPTVAVSTRRKGDMVEIRVADNGPGIPKNLREKILEPFYTTKPTGSGTGLGLSLTYDIVTQGHGGTLAVESTEGHGATFVITLPAAVRPSSKTRDIVG